MTRSSGEERRLEPVQRPEGKYSTKRIMESTIDDFKSSDTHLEIG